MNPDPLDAVSGDYACELRAVDPGKWDVLEDPGAPTWEQYGQARSAERLELSGPGAHLLHLCLSGGDLIHEYTPWAEPLRGNCEHDIVEGPDGLCRMTAWSGDHAIPGFVRIYDGFDKARLRTAFDELTDKGGHDPAELDAAWECLQALLGFLQRTSAKRSLGILHRVRCRLAALDLPPVAPPPPLPTDPTAEDPTWRKSLADCIAAHGVKPNHPDNEWPLNLLSIRTVVFASGRLARAGDAVPHDYDPAELARCNALAGTTTALLVRSPAQFFEAGPYFPFTLPADREAVGPSEPTADFVRTAFRGTVNPWAKIVVGPLAEFSPRGGPNAAGAFGWSGAQVRAHEHVWGEFDRWFADQTDFVWKGFVHLQGNGLAGPLELWVVGGLTAAGSLAGAGVVVPAMGCRRGFVGKTFLKSALVPTRSEPKWKKGAADGRSVLVAVAPGDFERWSTECCRAERRVRSPMRGRVWRTLFRDSVPVAFEYRPGLAWEPVYRCLQAGWPVEAVDGIVDPYTASPIDGSSKDHFFYLYDPGAVQRTADRLASVGVDWLRQRYDDLRATDYAPRRSEADRAQTLAVFEATRDFYTRAAAAGLAVVAQLTRLADEELAAEEDPTGRKAPAAAPSVAGPVTNCPPDDDRLAVLLPCTENYGVDDDDGDWPHNSVARNAVVYSCGRIDRGDGTARHDHDPVELALCRSLSAEAAKLVEHIEEPNDQGGKYPAFYVCANRGDPVPTRITEELIRSAFGGTLCPENRCAVEPFVAGGGWWNPLVARHWIPEEQAVYATAWNSVVAWFQEKKLLAPSFVAVGLSDDDRGSAHPRLVVGLTAAGSLVGVCGYVIFG